MAATDQNYRSSKALDITFAATCLLMLVSVVWMFVQDYNREFKVEQRQFRDVEEAVAQRQAVHLVPDENKRAVIKAAEEKLASARKNRGDKAAEQESQLSALL